MSETFYYADLGGIMTAPTFDGQVVPAAYGDQVRENMMALYRRETFCVSSSTGTIISNLGVDFNTTVWATPNCALVAGGSNLGHGVKIPNGIWLLGFSGVLGGSSVSYGMHDITLTFFAIEQVTSTSITGIFRSSQTFGNTVYVTGDGSGSLTGSIAAGILPTFWGVQISDL